MYPEFNKVNDFLAEASLLMNTSKRMEDIFNLTMKRNEKRDAVEYLNEKGKVVHYNYAKMRSNSYAFASILAQFLFQKEKHLPIIIKVENGPHWGEIFWATLMAGYKPLLIDAKTSKEGTQNLIDQSKAIAIISEDVFQYSILKISLEDLLQEKHHYTFSPDWENEVIFCSSGTTGDVKLMIFNGENLSHQICCSLDMPKETKDLMYPDKMGEVRILAMIPFHHIFGFVAVFLWFTYYGRIIVYPNSNAPSDIQSLCQKVGVTHIFSVPLFWDSIAQTIQRRFAMESEEKQELLDKMIGYNTGKISKSEASRAGHDKVKEYVQNQLLGSKIKYCISGGGFLSKQTLTIINGIGYNLYNGFGMTEIGVTSVELSPEVLVRLKGRIGRPLHGVEYKILPSGKNKNSGELLVKSPTIHVREIIGGEEKMTEFDEEGFVHTGDIAEVDATGGYYLKGRIKDIIINADGENVFPDELEIFFRGLPHVTHLCVLGIAKKNSKDENVSLVLELDNQVTDEEIVAIKDKIAEISANLPHNVAISKIYLAKNKLPLANNMKVKRFLVKKGIESKSKDFVSIDSKKETKTFEGFDQETIESILLPMRDIFSKILILPKFKIEDSGHWINDLGGDSMSYIELIRDIEYQFEIKIPEEKYGQLTCINDFVYEVAVLKKEQANNESDNK